jgi:hypothetical protein
MQNNLESLHHQAMELVDRLILAKQQGDEAGSLELLRPPLEQAKLSAFEQERSAANLVADKLDFEPTRSVLHRSAASLAVLSVAGGGAVDWSGFSGKSTAGYC